MKDEERCFLKDYEGTMESLCHICLHRKVCVVPISKIPLWVNFCIEWSLDKSLIEELVRLGRLRRKKP